ncbi:MAG TPA: response regulator [Acidobacteriaceae bacterium]|nr:response regulator [Acidobacteriaceae bacterium]
MTIDSTPPQENPASAPQANSTAPRQKQSFRRRRKRRGPANPAQGAAPSSGQNQGHANGGSGGHAQAGNGIARNENQARKPKKRFFKKGSGQGQNAGQNTGHNQGQGNGRNGQQQRRGSKQRRAPKVFVGPMDHSYRAANGNYADAPPSTIELQRGQSNPHYGVNGNGNGNSHGNGNGNYAANQAGSPVELTGSLSAEAAAAQSAAPARIYCFIDDLFFIAKIQETARKLGIKVNFVKNDKETVAQMLALPEAERPTLIVLDLNNVNAKPLTLIPKLKLKLKRATSIVGFLSHLQGELKAKAIEAGCDAVMPRSAFSQTLPNLLRRYGVEVEEDLTQVAGA